MKLFDATFIISMPGSAARLKQAKAAMKAAGLPAKVFPATDGTTVPIPSWWRAGPGAWGCYLSHLNLLLRMQSEKWESMLVVEDDVIWRPDTAARLPELLAEVPADCGQLYLGGQHRRPPKAFSNTLYVGRSIQRTHAYVVYRRALKEMIGLLLNTQEFSQGAPRHIDHQLEIGHQWELWKTYAASWWLAGQRENLSTINNRQQQEKWWHWVDAPVQAVPVVVTTEVTAHPQLCFLDPEELRGAARCPLQTRRVMSRAWQHAAVLGALPAIVCEDPHRLRVLRAAFPLLVNLADADLPALLDYPANGAFPHPWLNPA